MTLTIELTPEQEARLQVTADQADLTPMAAAKMLVEIMKQPPAGEVVFLLLFLLLMMKDSPSSDWQPFVDEILRNGTDEQIAAILPQWLGENAASELRPLEELPTLQSHQGTLYVRGTGIKVRLLAEETRQGYTVADIQQAHPQLTLAQIHAALAYYYTHQVEMDTDLQQRAQRVEEWRAKSSQMTRQQVEDRLQQQGYHLTAEGVKKIA